MTSIQLNVLIFESYVLKLSNYNHFILRKPKNRVRDRFGIMIAFIILIEWHPRKSSHECLKDTPSLVHPLLTGQLRHWSGWPGARVVTNIKVRKAQTMSLCSLRNWIVFRIFHIGDFVARQGPTMGQGEIVNLKINPCAGVGPFNFAGVLSWPWLV